MFRETKQTGQPMPKHRTARVVSLEDGWWSCRSCSTRVAFGLGAVHADARLKCPRCGVWLTIGDTRPDVPAHSLRAAHGNHTPAGDGWPL